jgi:hypothetical protein
MNAFPMHLLFPQPARTERIFDMRSAISALTVLVVVAAVAAATAAAGIAETIKLTPRNGSGVTGTATLSSPGDAAAAAVVKFRGGLKPYAFVRIQLNAVAGKTRAPARS